MEKVSTKVALKMALTRFLRTVVPQIPALLSYVAGIKPEYAAILSALGALITALDKFLRELKVY